MNTLDKVRGSVQEGGFELPLVSITLTQMVSAEPNIARGSGRIWLDENRVLNLQMIDADKHVSLGHSLIAAHFRTEPGRLLDTGQYYQMSATDIYGREWTAKHLSLDSNGGTVGAVVTATLYFIEHRTSTGPPVTSLVVQVPYKCKIGVTEETFYERKSLTGSQSRKTLNSAKASCVDWNFAFISEDDYLDVRADGPVMPMFPVTRTREAIEFALGVDVLHSWTEEIANGKRRVRIWSTPLDRVAKGVAPIYGLEYREEFRQLFERYCAFVWNYAEDAFHPVSHWLSIVRRATSSPAVPLSRGLTLGVAIEGVLKECYSDLDPVSDDTKDGADKLMAYVRAWSDASVKAEIADSLRNRAVTPIGQMKTPRAMDRLLELERRGVLTERDIKAWKDLRNAAAHARTPDDDQLQEWIDLCGRVEVALYRLIFNQIGYEGAHIDYGEYGYPRVTFPPQ